MTRSFRNSILAWFAVVSLILLIIGVIVYRNIQRLIEDSSWVTHTYEVLFVLSDTLSDLKDIQGAQRGYIITGQARYLEPYYASRSHINNKVERLRGLTADNPHQQRLIPVLQSKIQQRIDLAAKAIAVRQNQGFKAAQKIVLTGVGKRETDEIRALVATMEQEENRLLRRRSEVAQAEARSTLVSGALGFGGCFGVLLVVFSLMRREGLRRARAEAVVQESYDRLLQLEKMRDELTHMIVHDLRTPLTSFLGGLQTMGILGELNADQQEFLGISISGGQTLLGMINDLLDISKMEAGELSLEFSEVAPVSLCRSALEQVESLAKGKDIVLTLETPAALPVLLADADKLRRTLVNLLGNAVKFTPDGGQITAIVRAGESEDTILFAVADTGHGIPQEAFERIFEKFGQVQTHQKGAKMSTGLGLTFCKMVVEAHGGRIWVESELQKGSTFYFTIPRRQDRAPQAREPQTPH